MSEETKTVEISNSQNEPAATKLPSADRSKTSGSEAQRESEKKPGTEKITNEKELSREQKTAVKKLKDYSREAKKRVKQNDRTEGDDDSEQNEHTEDERSEIKTEKSKISVNTFLAFGTLLIGLAGLYLAYKNYLINQIKAGKHDDMIKIQPTPTTPKQTEKKILNLGHYNII